jgi:4-hydroxy-2-oxoheptanedioate aldolase
MRPNKVKHKLTRGEAATVVTGEMTPDLVEVFGSLGFDGVWIEGEHGPIDFGDIGEFTRAADLWGMTSVARVNLNLPGVIYRTLDQGAQAIVVPHVNTAEEARAVVEASKFAPVGARGSYTSRQGIDVDDYFTTANDETMTIILIEDIVAINNLDEILNVDHIDVFFVARTDLAQSMGFVGQPAHPEVDAIVDQAIEQIVAAGRVPGTIVTSATVAEYVEKGVRFLNVNYTPWLMSGAEGFLKNFAASVEP